MCPGTSDRPVAAERSFRELGRVHEALHELFFRHQDGVVQGDLAAAREFLERFGRAIRAHIAAEEDVLIPLYAERTAPQLGGSAELLLAEHRKIQRLTRKAGERLAVFESAGRIAPRERLHLLDEEYMLKQVLDHHDRRERAVFFPELDRLLNGPEREEAWRRCDALHGAGGLP